MNNADKLTVAAIAACAMAIIVYNAFTVPDIMPSANAIDRTKSSKTVEFLRKSPIAASQITESDLTEYFGIDPDTAYEICALIKYADGGGDDFWNGVEGLTETQRKELTEFIYFD